MKVKIPILLSLLLSGCAVGPDYKVPEVKVPSTWLNQREEKCDVLNQWWKQFNDPLLDKLVARALENNHDLAIAKSRVLEARAGSTQAERSLLPSFSVSGSSERDRNLFPLLPSRTPYSIFRADFDVLWEIDLFGGRRRQAEAANALAEASEAQLKAVHISIIAEVVKNYVDYRLYQRQVHLTEDNMKTQKETVALTQKQFEAGRAAKFDYLRANSQLKTTEVTIHTFTIALTQAQYRLETLLGEVPGSLAEELKESKAIPTANKAILSQTPVQVMQNRPDLHALERNLAAKTALKGAAIADLYPKFSLSAFWGGASLSGNTLFSKADRSRQILTGVKVPIFAFGRLEAAVDQSDALMQEALHQYKKGVLEALAEVETSYKVYEEEQHRLSALQEAVRDAKQALTIAQTQYREGAASLLEVLDVQRNLFSLEAQEAQIIANVAVAYVTLGKALGLGWVVEKGEGRE